MYIYLAAITISVEGGGQGAAAIPNMAEIHFTWAAFQWSVGLIAFRRKEPLNLYGECITIFQDLYEKEKI